MKQEVSILLLWWPLKTKMMFVFLLQIPNVLFFQELLWYQDGFCKHYADSLDGCGLQQESVVRESFYALIRKLADPYHKNRRIQMEKYVWAMWMIFFFFLFKIQVVEF